MPHADFDAARREHDEEFEPVTFTLCGELWTALREPSWGDVLALADAPEIPQNSAAAMIALQKFIRALLPVEDRQRWDMAMFKLPASQAPEMLFGVAAHLAANITGFPTMPPDSSSSSQETTGESSELLTGGTVG